MRAQEMVDAQRPAAQAADKAHALVQDKVGILADMNITAHDGLALAQADAVQKIALQQCLTKEGWSTTTISQAS